MSTDQRTDKRDSYIAPIYYVTRGITSFSHIMAASSHSNVFPGFLKPVFHISLSKQLAAFTHRLLAHWWKRYEAFGIDFCQKSEQNVGQAGVPTHNPWTDSLCFYRLTNKTLNSDNLFLEK